MFQSTRIKLTVWYLLIIMTVSILFSFAIYTGINAEFQRIEKFEKARIEEEIKGANRFFTVILKERQEQGLPIPKQIQIGRRIDAAFIQESRIRIIIILGIVNGMIFLISAALGYFLAGRTLRPIQKMVEEQNRFITDASHELRTPLTSLKAAIEVNLRDKQLTMASAKKVLESNLEEVNSLQILSDRLIQLTQYQHNGTKMTFEKLSLKTVLTDAEKKVQALAKQKHIEIIKEIKEYSLEGEKQSLLELFVILLDNAIKYSPEKTTIRLSVKSIDGKVVIQVTDQGLGIAQKDLPHVFDRFYRADASRSKKETPGYGLGLSIAKHIVTLHNGTISAESDVNKGATFFVTFPKNNKF